MKYTFLLLLLLLSSCSSARKHDETPILSMQIVDRNGFSETISTKDRIAKYKNTDFLQPQPYQKVLRVFRKDREGKSSSKITTYHQSGHVWQYLDVVDGRAHGFYREWHANGQIKMELTVIEGFADLQQSAQRTWVFDEDNLIWDENGHLIAKIRYERGMLCGPSIYYYASGKIKKIIPYIRDQVDGDIEMFDEEGELKEKISFNQGLKEGLAYGLYEKDKYRYKESYQNDLLKSGVYFLHDGKEVAKVEDGFGFKATFEGDHVASLIQYMEGVALGVVELFDAKGRKTAHYHQQEGKKQGEEIVFYLEDKNGSSSRPKISLFWANDLLQGEVKTWYPSGQMESKREFNQNKKHGVSFAWYKTGEVMLMEEYDQDKLILGSYYKKGDKLPVSKVENGKGTATLFSSEGAFLKKVSYEKGQPVIETSK